MTLRQRLREHKISCHLWKQYRGEIQRLCISAQCLFSNKGIPWDIVEMELRDEGWLLIEESLWDVLQYEHELKRTLDGNDDWDIGEMPFDDTWTEEDYINFEEIMRK